MSDEDNNRKNEENDNNRGVPWTKLIDKTMDINPDRINSVVDKNSEHHDGQIRPSTSSSEMPVSFTSTLSSDVCHAMPYIHPKRCVYPEKCKKYCSRMPNTSTTNNTAMTSMDEAQQSSGESTVVQRPSTLLQSEQHSSGTASGGSATAAAPSTEPNFMLSPTYSIESPLSVKRLLHINHSYKFYRKMVNRARMFRRRDNGSFKLAYCTAMKRARRIPRRNICQENGSEMCGNAGPSCDGEAMPSADLDGKVSVMFPKNRNSSSSSSC